MAEDAVPWHGILSIIRLFAAGRSIVLALRIPVGAPMGRPGWLAHIFTPLITLLRAFPFPLLLGIPRITAAVAFDILAFCHTCCRWPLPHTCGRTRALLSVVSISITSLW